MDVEPPAMAIGTGWPSISVVIPTYNREDMIGRSISSVLDQEYEQMEVIVVDDGSTDGTIEQLARFGNRITILRLEHQERSRARNAGVAASLGEAIVFLDSDDEMLPGHLARVADPLRAGASEFAYTQAEFFDDVSQEIFDVFPRSPREGRAVVSAALRNFIPMSGVILRRTLFDRAGGFSEDLAGAEDWELWVRCLALEPITFVPGRTVRMHVHGSNDSMRSPDVREQQLREARTKILERHADALAPHSRKLHASFYSYLAHIHMLAGGGSRARQLTREAFEVDRSVIREPEWQTMAIKAVLGPSLIRWMRGVRRRFFLRRTRSLRSTRVNEK